MRRLALVLLFASMVCNTASANWVGSEGTDWLHWSLDKRRTYIEGLTQGIASGFSKACSAAQQAKSEYADTQQIQDACMKGWPLSQNEQMDYVSAITEFYARYPRQRFHYIREVFLELNKGYTVVQVNEHICGPIGANGVKPDSNRVCD